MPLTETGYERRTRDEVLTRIQAYLRDKISPKLDLSERTMLGNVSNLMADRIDELEQLVEEAHHAYDTDNASDDRFVSLSLLSGVPRRGAAHGLVSVQLELGSSLSFAPGELVAYVVDEPTNRWVNRDPVSSDAAGTYSAVFESEDADSGAIAEAGTLTEIAAPTAGWTAVTNPAAATPGTDIEAVAALRIRRELALSIGGSRTRGAIRSKLILLDGVLSAEVFENTTSATVGSIGPHGIRAVVWDGSPGAANDDEIAQVIYDHAAEGILAHGSETGTAQDPTIGPVTIAFDRATPQAVTVAVAIESETGVAADDVRAAIIAAMPQRVGKEVTFNRLASSVFKVQGVDDWGSFTVNGGTADLPAVQSRIYTLDPSDITVTGDVT